MKRMIVSISTATLLFAGTSSFTFANTLTSTGSLTTTASSTQASNTTNSSTSTSVSTPSVLPGDHFYGVLSSAEDAQLDVTPDNDAKAQLLNQYANEKIADSGALIQKGDASLAEETVQQAVDDQSLAMDLGGTTTSSSSTSNAVGTDTTTAGSSDSTSTDASQQIDDDAAANLQSLVNIISQMNNPEQKQALINAILDKVTSMSDNLSQDGIQVDVNFNEDQGTQDDQSDDNSTDSQSSDNQSASSLEQNDNNSNSESSNYESDDSNSPSNTNNTQTPLGFGTSSGSQSSTGSDDGN